MPERKSTEKAAFQSDTKTDVYKTVDDIRFMKIIENSYEGFTLLDKNLAVVYRSLSAERINGWPIDERRKYTVSDLIHPDDREQLTLLLQKVLITPEKTFTSIYRSKHFMGHYIWLESTFTNLLNDPEIEGIVCNFRDISDKKAAEDTLQQTINELFAYKYALNESSIVAITDQKGIIKHVNRNFCNISKYSEKELIGQDHRIINSGYHDKAFIQNLWKTIARGEIWKGELKNRAKDGSYYWVDTTIVPFLNEKGKPYQYLAIRSDITERKQSEERIIESEQFIKTITDNLPAMIAYWDARDGCLFANKPYLEWFEKNPEEMRGIDKRELLGEEEFALHQQHIEDVLRGIPQSFERTFFKPDGRSIFTHTQYLPDWQSNSVKGFYSLIYDITQIKLAESEIKKKAEQIEDILDNITDGFIALDSDRRYTYANKQIGLMLQRDPKELIGKKIWDEFPDAVGSATWEAIEDAYRKNKYICNEDHYAPLRLWQENRIYPSGGGISMFIRDITKSKQEEQHLRELNRDLQKHARELAISNEELEQFAYVASHDLQEPLRMVTSFLSQLEKKYSDTIDDRGKQYIHFAVDGAKRMRQIILDLLEYSRVGRAENELESVNVNELLFEILPLYRKQTEDLKAKIIFGTLPVINSYKAPLRQIFQNLIGNSLKYNKAGVPPLIEIFGTERTDDYLFSVKDNGIGISPEFFEKIFIIFQRLHNRDEYAGTGMGLAITKKIIESLGGRIWPESLKEQGIVFYFTISKHHEHETD